MVVRGQPIGKQGNTAGGASAARVISPKLIRPNASTGEHLHFALYRIDDQSIIQNATTLSEIRRTAKSVVPEPFLGAEAYENFQWMTSPGNGASNTPVTPRNIIPMNSTGNPTSTWVSPSQQSRFKYGNNMRVSGPRQLDT